MSDGSPIPDHVIERLQSTLRTVAGYHKEREAYGGYGRDFHAIALTAAEDAATALDELRHGINRLPIPDPADASHATTHRDIGPCRFCGAIACTGNVWPCQDRWRQVVCPSCRCRGPARPGFEEAIAAWRGEEPTAFNIRLDRIEFGLDLDGMVAVFHLVKRRYADWWELREVDGHAPSRLKILGADCINQRWRDVPGFTMPPEPMLADVSLAFMNRGPI